MTLEQMIEQARNAQGTTEERLVDAQNRMKKFNAAQPSRMCSECKCTLCIYGTGHTFSCSRRGSGY